MHKREIAWIVVLLLLIGAYIHYFSHWGEKREIQVLASARPMPSVRRRGGAPAGAPAVRLVFTLDNYYKLTKVKVTAVDSQHANAAAHVLWHLVSKTGSTPVKMFQYAQAIEGMEPDLPGVQPEPLVPGEKYRLEVSAGAMKGTSPPFAIRAAP